MKTFAPSPSPSDDTDEPLSPGTEDFSDFTLLTTTLQDKKETRKKIIDIELDA